MILGAMAWLAVSMVWVWAWEERKGAGPYAFLRDRLLEGQKAGQTGAAGGEHLRRESYLLVAVWLAVIYTSGSMTEMVGMSMFERPVAMAVMVWPSLALNSRGWKSADLPLLLEWDATHDNVVRSVYADLCEAVAVEEGVLGQHPPREEDNRRWLCLPPNWEQGLGSVSSDEFARHLWRTDHAIATRLPDDQVPKDTLDRLLTHLRLARGTLTLCLFVFVVSPFGWLARWALPLARRRPWWGPLSTMGGALFVSQIAFAALLRAESEYHCYLFYSVRSAYWDMAPKQPPKN